MSGSHRLSTDSDDPNAPPSARVPTPSAASQPPPRGARPFLESYEIVLPAKPDLICLSHLRWDFVFQRPQHLMTRFARDRRVFFIEEPHLGTVERDQLLIETHDGVTVVVPHLAARPNDAHAIEERQRLLLNDLLRRHEITDYILWYYTPMAMGFTRHLFPHLVVWDCMDELSSFAHAPRELVERERQLLGWSDLVFTGGQSLYEAKRGRHPRVYAFPSSIEAAHFAKARRPQGDPADQAPIPHPRIGFYGVLDERLDIDLLRASAAARPDWHWVLIGPVVKIDPAHLPRAANIHYLGKKDYGQLPHYLSGWDVAVLPFARNEATRFISPTKTPEYLVAGRPVVSTPITDVVRPYGEQGLVRIAGDADAFVAAIATAMAEGRDPRWLERVDQFLAGNSWDATYAQMLSLMDRALSGKQSSRRAPITPHTSEV